MDLAQDRAPEKGSSVAFGDLIAPPSLPPGDRDDPFRRLWKLGYRKLLPIIPPGVDISPNSTLFKKVGLRQDGRGKTPGIRKPNGQWISFDWLKHDTVEADLARWLETGAGVGIRTGKIDDELTLVAIDSDARDPEQAQIIFAEMERRFGPLPLRIGRDPKGLCPLLVRGSFPYSRVEFGERDENGRLIDRVEILSDDRQFVAAGTHPGTGRPYRWQRPLVPLSDLPIVEPDELTAFLDALRPLLPAASAIVGKLGLKNGTAPDQKGLIGEFDRIQKAIESLPNAADIDRDEYVRIGVALKAAAGPGYEADARDMFVDWAQRWEGAGEETTLHGLAETAEADFRRFHPPFHLGAEYLFAQAIKRSGGAFTAGDAYFEKPSNVVPLFPEAQRNPVMQADASIAWTDPEAWVDKPIPAREWEVRDWIPRHEVTLLYGDGGIGKTLLMHQYAVAASAGVSWLGQETRQARVMCFFCEDGEDELQRRHADILRALGLTHADTAGRLRIASRRNTDNLMALWDRHSGAMKRQAVWEQLRSDALAFRADVVIMDTIADIFAGEEQNRAQVTSFVKGVLGRLAAEIGGSVIALGHPSQAGKASKEGTSGSTGWSNAVRSRLYLSYPSGTTSGNVRELEGKKLNYGAKGAKLKMRWNRGAFDLIASSTPLRTEGASAFPASTMTVEAGVERDVLDAVALHPDVRMVLTGKTSPYFAPTVLKKREPALLVAWTPDEVVAAVERLEAAGVIRSAPIGQDASRRTTYGLRIDADRLSARDAAKPGVFD